MKTIVYQSRRSISISSLSLLITSLLFPACTQALSDQAPAENGDLYTIHDFLNQFQFKKADTPKTIALFSQKDGNAHLKVKQFKNLSFDNAKSAFQDKVFSVSSLYRETFSPYPGALSNRINCPEELKPKRITHPPFDYFLLYANQRFVYGACSWDLVAYKAILFPLYCPKTQQLYQMELFVPKDQDTSLYEKALPQLSCD